MSRYDIEKFDPAPDPDLVCCICQCVLDKAVECPCRHVFCQGCIERWLTNRHTCPTCRKRTMKQDLQPVLPLVQNMLNRLLMICDYRDNGCLDKIMLEHYENHIKDCGYEMKTCRFIKCGKNILKMYLEQHENTDCEHRESLCGGECGLMIALSDRPTHECMDALKAHIDEKNRMIETLKSKLHELNNLSQSLNDQLEQLRQQLDENRPRSSMSLYSGSDTDVTEFMSDQESIFDDSNDNITDFSDTNSVNNDTSTVDNVGVDDNNGGDNNDSSPVNDVMEQVEVTVVNSLFDLSSRLDRVRDEMRTVLNTGTVADNDNLTENLGMRSARIDDIIDNMSRSINDTSVRSSRSESQRTVSREEQNSDRTVVTQANENRNNHETSPRSDDLNNNMYGVHNGSERDAHSDHSYSAGSSWRWPENFSTYNNYRSPYHSERSPSHSELSPRHSNVSPFRDSLSNRSYSNTPEGTPYRPLTLDSYRRWYGSSRSASPNSDRFSDQRSNFSRSPSRSPADSFHSNRYSRGSPSYRSSPASELRSPSIASNRSNSGRSWSNFSATPINSDDQRSIGSLSPRSPASGNWSSDGWNSDHRGSEGSRHSGDNWSYKSKSSVSHRNEGSNDEGRSVVDSPRSDNSYRHNSDRDSVVSDWCTSGNRTPEPSPRHFDSDDDRGSRTPISTADNLDTSSGHLTSPNQSEPGTETPHEITSSEEFSPRKTTPAKSEESSYWSGSSPIHPQSSPYQDRNQSVSEAAESETSSPLKASTRSVEKRKSVKNKKLSSTAETNKYRSQTASTGKNEFRADSKTSIEKTDDLGVSRRSVEVKTGNREGLIYQCNIRHDNKETRSSTSDSGIYSGVCGSETSQDDFLPRTVERKRKANNEKEHTTSTDSLRKSKRNRSSTVSVDSHQVPVIPSSTAMIQTSLPQSLQTPSNVNLKIDLSLYNISGQLIPQTKPISATNCTNKPPTNSGSSVTEQAITSYTSTASPVKNLTDSAKASVQRQKPTKAVHTRTSSPSHVKPEVGSPQTRSQNKENTEKRPKRQAVLNRQNSSNSNSSSLGNRDFPNSWCDDSDSESDQTWVPGPDKSETDDTLTEEEEILSDSSYEVHIPKTAADLLDEYKSDDTDDSWAPN